MLTTFEWIFVANDDKNTCHRIVTHLLFTSQECDNIYDARDEMIGIISHESHIIHRCVNSNNITLYELLCVVKYNNPVIKDDNELYNMQNGVIVIKSVE